MKLGLFGSLTALVALFVAQETNAVPITGEVYFGSFQNVRLTGGSGTFATATGLDFANSPWDAIVGASSSGDFTVLGPTFATFNDFDFAGSGLPADVWQIGALGFVFELQTVGVQRSANGIILNGNGEVRSTTDASKDVTPGSFFFSLQGNDLTASSFSFSANNDFTAVPDGGASAILLGFGLLGLASFRRIFAK